MGYFTGKTVIITGAGRAVLSDGRCGSIGYGIATAYAKEGANIVITGRNVQKLQDAKEELERLYGVKVLPIQADISAGADNAATAAMVVEKVVAEFGGIDVLINNAQASASGVTLADHTLAQFDLAVYSGLVFTYSGWTMLLSPFIIDMFGNTNAGANVGFISLYNTITSFGAPVLVSLLTPVLMANTSHIIGIAGVAVAILLIFMLDTNTAKLKEN